MGLPIQSDVELLKKLLLGQLPVADAERLAVEYADDSRLSELAAAIADPDDTLLTDLRNHRTHADPNAERLIGRLMQRLREAALFDGASNDTSKVKVEPSAWVSAMPEHLEYFRVRKVLGEGGMGTVYLADDTRLDRKVALKTLRRERADDPAAKNRFLREARSAARLDHDHIIPVYYVGEADGIPFLAMPFLQGEPLDERIRREQAAGKLLPISETMRITGQIASGLAAAHARGLIHRDVKPANVWLEGSDGRVKILDFGLARSQDDQVDLTASGLILGTPAYMAPEQARGASIDHRADLFSLGCILYEMLTGNRPFTGQDTMAILSSLAIDVPPAPRQANLLCPESLSRLTMQMLEKQPVCRTASARAVVDALAKIGAAESAAPTRRPIPFADVDHAKRVPENTPQLASETKPHRRRRVSVFAVGLLLAFIGGGAAFGGTIFRILTNQGELVIEIDDKDIEVKIAQNGVVVQDKTNRREFALRAGKGEIEVLERNGVRLTTKTFSLTRNGETTVRITLEELTDARKPKPKLEPQPIESGDPDRKAAEYVLSVGGTVGVNELRDDVSAAANLPREPFRLTRANLRGSPKATDAAMFHFQDCKNLTELFLGNTNVSHAGVAYLKNCKNLMHLYLGRTKVTDAGLAYLKHCANLTTLYLESTQVGDTGLAHLKDCKNLKTLYLESTQASDAGLAYLKDCDKLTTLVVSDTKVTDAGLVHLERLQNLMLLRLKKTKVTAAGIDRLKPKISKCTIEWDGVAVETKQATDPDRKAAEYAISVGGTVRVNDREQDLKAAGDLPAVAFRLTQVNLSGKKPVSDAGPAAFDHCKNPKNLDLWGTKVGDAGLAHLKDCANLTNLRLDGAPITDAGLAALKDRKRLTNLALWGTPVTDAAVAALKDFKNLTALDLQKTRLTAAMIAELKKALPKCKIVADGAGSEPKGK